MAANDALQVTINGKPMAQNLVNLSNQARALHYGLIAFKAQLDHLTDGTAGSYGTIETVCGLPAAAGAVTPGSDVYAAMGAVQTLLTNNDYFQALCHRIQQV